MKSREDVGLAGAGLDYLVDGGERLGRTSLHLWGREL